MSAYLITALVKGYCLDIVRVLDSSLSKGFRVLGLDVVRILDDGLSKGFRVLDLDSVRVLDDGLDKGVGAGPSLQST